MRPPRPPRPALAQQGTRTKYQHYVPRLHLKHFVGEQPKGMIWTYDMATGKRRPSTIKETGGENNFYSPVGVDGARFDGLDQLLTNIEGRAAVGYEMLLKGEIPEGQSRADFASFVATLYTRTPRVLNAAAAMIGRMAQFTLNMRWRNREAFERSMDAYEADEGPLTISRDDLWTFHQDPTRYTLSVKRHTALPAVAAADRIQEILFARRWRVAPAFGRTLITCDSPVFRSTPAGEHHTFYGDGGFLNPAAEITLPLTPNMMLMISDRDLGAIPVLPPSAVLLANQMRAFAADRLLFSHRDDDEVAALAAEFKDEGPEWGFDFQGPMPEIEVRAR